MALIQRLAFQNGVHAEGLLSEVRPRTIRVLVPVLVLLRAELLAQELPAVSLLALSPSKVSNPERESRSEQPQPAPPAAALAKDMLQELSAHHLLCECSDCQLLTASCRRDFLDGTSPRLS
mgnify:CR=1 FL=1